MDWSMRLAMVSVCVVMLPVLYLVIAVHYCKWLHKRGVAEPEKLVVLLLKASVPGRRAREVAEEVKRKTTA